VSGPVGRVWIPYRGRRGGAGRANSKKDLVTGPIRGLCALQVRIRPRRHIIPGQNSSSAHSGNGAER
jgi:hypothetical protein